MLLRALTPLHLIVLGAIALLVFGPKRLPELGGAIGKTMQEFRKSMQEAKDDPTGEKPQEASSARPN